MTSSGAEAVYERGDVVYGTGPFKDGGAGRPWLVVSNHVGQPFHGEQYIVLTLTTKRWHDDFIEIPDQGWVDGGAPRDSRIVPWGVQSIGREDIDRWQGRLEDELVDEAIDFLVEYLNPPSVDDTA